MARISQIWIRWCLFLY